MVLGKTLKPAHFELEVRSFPTVEDGIIIKMVFDKMVVNNDWEEFSPKKIGLSEQSLERLRFMNFVKEGSKKNKYIVTDRFIGQLVASGALI